MLAWEEYVMEYQITGTITGKEIDVFEADMVNFCLKKFDTF